MKMKLSTAKAAPVRPHQQKLCRYAPRCQAQQQAETQLSGDVLAMFHEAQRNILQLNKSRLLALHELRLAKDRICALESICAEAGLDYSGAPSMWAESATAHQYVMTTQPLPDDVEDSESPSELRAALAKADADAPESMNGAAAAPQSKSNSRAGGAQPGASTTAAPITVEYVTGWKQAYIHHSKSDGSWTSMPGVQMRQASKAGLYTVELDQEKAEFVFNNGGQDWDGPWNAENYVIDRPGKYQVKNGKVSRLSGSKDKRMAHA